MYLVRVGFIIQRGCTMVTMEKVDRCGANKQTILHVTLRRLLEVLGDANVADDESKVSHSWGIELDGDFIGVWSWKGSETYDEFSVYHEGESLGKLKSLLIEGGEPGVWI